MVNDMQWYLPSPAEYAPSPYPNYYGDAEIRTISRSLNNTPDILQIIRNTVEALYRDAATVIQSAFRYSRPVPRSNRREVQVRLKRRADEERLFYERLRPYWEQNRRNWQLSMGIPIGRPQSYFLI